MHRHYRNLSLRRAARAACVLLLQPSLGVAQADPPPPGRLVEVDGRRMHVHCIGAGSPTVVIDAGAASWSLAWLDVQERVRPTTRTCVYDRAGLGWSEARPEPRTSERAARELQALLHAAGEAAPFVLVGHSYGGYTVRVFADLFPDDVAAVTLVESAHEDQWERLPPVVKQLLDASMADMRSRADAARRGELSPDSVELPAFYSADPYVAAAYRAEQVDPDHHRTAVSELEEMEPTTARVRAAGALGSMPLGVLSSARGFDIYRGSPIPVQESNRIWLELQSELAMLSEDVIHVITNTGSHSVHREEPELVAGLIREIVRRARAGARVRDS